MWLNVAPLFLFAVADQWCDVLGFVTAGSFSSSTTLHFDDSFCVYITISFSCYYSTVTNSAENEETNMGSFFVVHCALIIFSPNIK